MASEPRPPKPFRNANGSLTTTLFDGPVHYRNEDGWEDIEDGLVASSEPGYAWENGANAFDVFFKDVLEERFLKINVDGETYALEAQGALRARPDRGERSVSYREAFSGVDLTYDLMPHGLKETLVLHDARTPSHFRFVLTAKEGAQILTEQQPDGSWAFYAGGSDEPVFLLGPAFASEAVPPNESSLSSPPSEVPLPSPASTVVAETPTVASSAPITPTPLPSASIPQPTQEPVPAADSDRHADLSVSELSNNRFAIDLDIDAAWLHDPQRNFPIVVDPTITIATAVEDASFEATCSGCRASTGSNLNIGTDADSAWRAALRFDVSDIPIWARITEAELRLFHDNDTCLFECPADPMMLSAHRMTQHWSTASRSSDLLFDQAQVDSYRLPGSASTRWMEWQVTNLVKSWQLGTQDNFGLLVKAESEDLGAGGTRPPGRRFSSTPEIRPRLEVTYEADAVQLLNLSTLHSDGAELEWTQYNSMFALNPFTGYEVHRSRSADFTPSASTLIAMLPSIDTTTYRDFTAAPNTAFSYKIVVGNQASNERRATLPQEGQAITTLQAGNGGGSSSYIKVTPTESCRNFGGDDSLFVGTKSSGEIFRSLVHFDVSDIPSVSSVTSASLELWHPAVNLESSVNERAHKLTGDWDEGSSSGACDKAGVSWDEAVRGVPWIAPGADFDPNSVGQETNSDEAAGWDDFDVKDAVQDWVSTEANFGILVKERDESTAQTNLVQYASDDSGLAPTLRPKLTLSYLDGSHARGPTVEIIEPSGDIHVAGKAVHLRVEASDDGKVERVEYLIDDEVIASATSEPFIATWDSTQVGNTPPGSQLSYELEARAFDDAGNASLSEPVLLEVANTEPPEVRLSAPNEGATIKGSTTLTAEASDDDDVTGHEGIASISFLVDDELIAEDTVHPYSVSWDTLDPAHRIFDGPHVLTARAVDIYGVRSESQPVPVVVGNALGTKYMATIEALGIPSSVTFDPALQTQESYPVDLVVVNESPVVWDLSDITLSYTWRSTTLPSTEVRGPDVPLNEPLGVGQLPPGGIGTASVAVQPPPLDTGESRATYELTFDLFDLSGSAGSSGTLLPLLLGVSSTEGSQGAGDSFSEKGNSPERQRVTVNKALEAGQLGIEGYFGYESQALGLGINQLTNIANGNSLIDWDLSSSPGRGLSTVVSMTHNSYDTSESVAGNGFSLSISSLSRFGTPLTLHAVDARGQEANRYVEFIDGDGTTHRFTGREAGDGSVWWEEPPGVHLYLSRSPDPTRTWTFTRPDGVRFYFDQDGYPTGVEDRNGNLLRFVLDEVSPQSNDPGGAKKQIVSVVDPAGNDPLPEPKRSYEIVYHDRKSAPHPKVRGNIRTISDHEGHVFAFFYYRDGNLLAVTQRDEGTALPDRSVVFTYTTPDGSGPAIASSDQRRNPDPKTANQSSRLYSFLDASGRETVLEYFGPTSGQLRWRVESVTDRAASQTSYSYDLSARTTTVTAPESRTTVYGYDPNSHVVTVKNPKDEATTLEWSTDRQLTKVIEPTGKFTRFDHNDNGYLTDVFDQLGNHTELAYSNDQVDSGDVSGKWKQGRTIPHLSLLSSKTDPLGSNTETPGDFEWRFFYDARGNLSEVEDSEGASTTYDYNSNGTMRQITDGEGHQTSYEYDANGLINKQTQHMVTEADRVTRVEYDADGIIKWIQDPAHASYEGGTPSHYRTYFKHDDFHRLWRVIEPLSTPTRPGTLIFSGVDYDKNDNVTASYQPEYFAMGSDKTTFSYDEMDRIKSVTSPDRSVGTEKTTYDYDAAGRLTKMTLPKGVATSSITNDYATIYTYDKMDRVVQEMRQDIDVSGTVLSAQRTHMCYSLSGDLVKTISPRAAVVSVDCASNYSFQKTFAYDDAHRLISIKGSEPGRERLVSYDDNGNTTTFTDERGKVTRRIYNERNELVRLEEPLEGTREVVTRFSYDGVGNLKKLESPKAVDSGDDALATFYHYNAAKELVKIELPHDQKTTPAFVHQSYDSNGRLTSTSLPVANSLPSSADPKTSLTYFDPGWIRTQDDPTANPRVTYEYTPEGWQSLRSARHKEKSSRKVKTTYFADGQLKSVHDHGGQPTTYSYDLNNNLKTAVDASGFTSAKEKTKTTNVTYDGLDRVSKVTQDMAGTPQRYTNFFYDLNSNVRRREDDGQTNPVRPPRVHLFTYDQDDWLVSHEDQGTTPADTTDDVKVQNSYYPDGLYDKKEIYRGGSLKEKVTSTYFDNDQLKSQTTTNGAGSTIESHVLSYEAEGVYMNGHTVRDWVSLKGSNSNCNTSSCTIDYVYDGRDRVLEEQRTGFGPDIVYELDLAGNVTKKTAAGSPEFTATYSGNQIASRTVSGVTSKYFYDAFGNLACVTKDSGQENDCGDESDPDLIVDYDYDYLGRLHRYRAFSSTGTVTDSSTYSYDAFDRLVEQKETHPNAADSRTSVFSYVGMSDLLSKETHSGGSSTTKTYSYDPTGVRTSMHDSKSAKTYYYSYDPHSSVSALINNDGTTKATYGYDAYGNSIPNLTEGDNDLQNPLNPYRYTAKRFDSGSQSLDMGARRFASERASFLQRDQFLGALDDLSLSVDPLTQNRYALAGGNPVSYVEWDGHRVATPQDDPHRVRGGRMSSHQEATLARIRSVREHGGDTSIISADSDELRQKLARQAADSSRGSCWFPTPFLPCGDELADNAVVNLLVGDVIRCAEQPSAVDCGFALANILPVGRLGSWAAKAGLKVASVVGRVLRRGDGLRDLRHATRAIGPIGNPGALAFRGIQGLSSKSAARQALAGLDATQTQLTLANRAIGRATTSSTIDVGTYGNRVVVRIAKQGDVGQQVIESVISPEGWKSVVQMGYDDLGRLTHYDPKTP